MKKTFKFVIEVTGDLDYKAPVITGAGSTALDSWYENSVFSDISSQIMSDIIKTESSIITSNVDKEIEFTPIEIKINTKYDG